MKIQEICTLYHSVYNLNYHLVIVTKFRKRCISPKIMDRLRDICRDLLIKWECELLEFNGESDHIHLLIKTTPKVNLATLVNNIKTVSSRLIRKEFAEEISKVYWKPVFWSRSYCILSCGRAPLSVIKQYIEQQGDKKHPG